MANTKQDFNNTPTGIAIVSAVSAAISYRAIRKDPQKVRRIRKRAPLLAAGIFAASAAIQVAAKNSTDPKLQELGAKSVPTLRRSAVGGAAVASAALVTAKLVIGERTHVSVRRALVWVTLTTGYSVANRVYNRAALPAAEVAERLSDEEQFRKELTDAFEHLQRSHSKKP